ncbi:hypothetical protein A6A03_10445 [Chloroflexus islandicus]|uniref:Uncharacterized protein n=1 Tax=Chloroflexus islandicus TaxID=1707952 RepID=A0A178MFY8_9CHLR|nr:hypothetical protein A6A03_10445 [Chloroflexus islandicus]
MAGKLASGAMASRSLLGCSAPLCLVQQACSAIDCGDAIPRDCESDTEREATHWQQQPALRA